jgi:hypothetical protein
MRLMLQQLGTYHYCRILLGGGRGWCSLRQYGHLGSNEGARDRQPEGDDGVGEVSFRPRV